MDGRITPSGVSAATLWFSYRPYRLTGHLPTDEFVTSWGQGDNNFAEDPPNALLSIFEDEEVNDVVIILSDPKLDAACVEAASGEKAKRARRTGRRT
jgi:hypothetical protein